MSSSDIKYVFAKGCHYAAKQPQELGKPQFPQWIGMH